MPRIAALLLVAGLGLTTAACSTNPATGDTSLVFMTPAEEQRIGADEHPKVTAEYGGTYDHNGLAAYVTAVGNKLAAVSERKDINFTFTVLDSDIVNAFALPGGYVYVTRGLIALTSSEAELAGVIGHEIGHVVARHTAQRDARSKVAGLGAGLLEVFLGPDIGSVVDYGASAYVQKFSRDQEFESDMLGVRYLARAGYDPSAMAGFLSKLMAISEFEAQKAGRGTGEGFDIMASHPRTLERVADAIKQAKEKPIANPTINRDQLLSRLDGMAYGVDPAKGIVRGQSFFYPPLKLKFTAPARFQVQNGAEQVSANGLNSQGFSFDLGSAPAGQSAGDYLRTWADRQPLSGAETLTVMGKPAATALTTAKTDSGQSVAVRMVAIQAEENRVYRFQFFGKPNDIKSLNALTTQVLNSLSPLSETDATSLKLARIAIVTAATPTEANALVSKMKYEGATDRRLYEILNGLSPGEMPPPGVKLKIIQ
jgi:predicted Zn-dependent protease